MKELKGITEEDAKAILENEGFEVNTSVEILRTPNPISEGEVDLVGIRTADKKFVRFTQPTVVCWLAEHGYDILPFYREIFRESKMIEESQENSFVKGFRAGSQATGMQDTDPFSKGFNAGKFASDFNEVDKKDFMNGVEAGMENKD